MYKYNIIQMYVPMHRHICTYLYIYIYSLYIDSLGAIAINIGKLRS